MVALFEIQDRTKIWNAYFYFNILP